MSEKEDDWHVEAGRKGGRKSRMSSEQAASNAEIDHGLYAKNANYFANLPPEEKRAIEFAYFMMHSNAGISDSYEDSVMDEYNLREAVVDLHKARSVESNAEHEKERTLREAARHRKYAVEALRDLDILDEDETTVERYFPEGPMFNPKLSENEDISTEQSTSPFER